MVGRPWRTSPARFLRLETLLPLWLALVDSRTAGDSYLKTKRVVSDLRAYGTS